MQKILVVTVNWFGDAIMTTPAFAALKQQYPQSEIAVLCPARVRGVFLNNPNINEIIIFDEKSSHKNLLSKILFCRQIRKKHFDTVFLIHRSLSKALIVFLAGIKKRIAYQREKTAWLITDPIKAPEITQIHRQDYYLELFRRAGIKIENIDPLIYLTAAEQNYGKDLAQTSKKKARYLIGINPAANWRLKRWPIEYFTRLADLLIENLNCAIYLCGTADQSRLIAVLKRTSRHKLIDLSGQTTIGQLAGLIQNTDLFISNDSGPAHLAAALNANTLVLFGPTSENITGPRGKKVKILRAETGCLLPCYNQNCTDNKCMERLSVETVYATANNLLTKP